jgi:hypothetical protein
MPNPVNEGIMQFYIRKVLERYGIWQTISGGKECVHCQTTDNNWFTAVHHRETPARIAANQSDAGIVWKTEVLAALRRRRGRSSCASRPRQPAKRSLLRDRHPRGIEAFRIRRSFFKLPALARRSRCLRQIWLRPSERRRTTDKANSLKRQVIE